MSGGADTATGKKLKKACYAELRKDLDSFVDGKVLGSYGKPFLPVTWNVETYREMRCIGVTNHLGRFTYLDFDRLISLMEQDNRFNASFLEKLATGESVRALSMQRAAYQKLILERLRKMTSP